MKLQRYDMGEGERYADPADYGGWVKDDDVDGLECRCAELTARLAEAEGQRELLREEVDAEVMRSRETVAALRIRIASIQADGSANAAEVQLLKGMPMESAPKGEPGVYLWDGILIELWLPHAFTWVKCVWSHPLKEWRDVFGAGRLSREFSHWRYPCKGPDQ